MARPLSFTSGSRSGLGTGAATAARVIARTPVRYSAVSNVPQAISTRRLTGARVSIKL